MSIYDSSYNNCINTGASYQMPSGQNYYSTDNLFNAPNNSMNDAYIWAKNNGIDVSLDVKDSVFAYSQNLYGAPVDAVHNADIWSRYADVQAQELALQAQAQSLINYNNQTAATSAANAENDWSSLMNMMMMLMQMEAMENVDYSSLTTTTASTTTADTTTSTAATTATDTTKTEEEITES